MDIGKPVNNMLVLQQIKVLPAGARIVITDDRKIEIKCKKSEFDDSLIFYNADESDKYYKVYSVFRCAKLTAYYIESIQDICYEIEVRG